MKVRWLEGQLNKVSHALQIHMVVEIDRKLTGRCQTFSVDPPEFSIIESKQVSFLFCTVD